jgi:aminoglycoside phosphotransferase (APT) family kinase protein
MTVPADEPRPTRAGEELDTAKLAAFLGGPVEVLQFPGGHSNLTYMVRHGGQELVLRRPPFGSKVKTAHDMGREVAVLSKLAPVFDRAPRVIAYEPTGDVLGAPFYLMERRHGVILRGSLPEELAGDHVKCARICDLLIDTLVDLHAIDFRAAGLGDFGKPVGYVERQVRGWSERYVASQTDDITAVTEVSAWLAAHMPADGPPALIHNDYKFDNVILDPSYERVVAVLDWEMATVGDPLMDLGTSTSYWVQSDDPPLFHQSLFGVTSKPGMRSRTEVAKRYLERSGRRTDSLVFYYAFGLFKTAVVLQQIYYRYAKGLTQDPRFAPFIHVVRALAERAHGAIERDTIS